MTTFPVMDKSIPISKMNYFMVLFSNISSRHCALIAKLFFCVLYISWHPVHPPSYPMQWVILLCWLHSEEMEAQKGQVTCLRSHSKVTIQIGLEPKQSVGWVWALSHQCTTSQSELFCKCSFANILKFCKFCFHWLIESHMNLLRRWVMKIHHHDHTTDHSSPQESVAFPALVLQMRIKVEQVEGRWGGDWEIHHRFWQSDINVEGWLLLSFYK